MSTDKEPTEYPQIDHDVSTAEAEAESLDPRIAPKHAAERGSMILSKMVSGSVHEEKPSNVDYVTGGIDKIKQNLEKVLSLLSTLQQQLHQRQQEEQQQQQLQQQQVVQAADREDSKLLSILTEFDKKLQQILNEFTTEKENINEQLTKSEKLMEARIAQERKKYEQDLQKHNDDVKKLHEMLDVERKYRQEVEELKKEAEEHKLDKAVYKKEKEHHENIASRLDKENKQHQSNEEKYVEETKELKSKIEEMESKNNVLKLQNEKLKKETAFTYVQQQEDIVKAQKIEIDELKKANENLKEKLSGKDSEIDGLKCEVAALKESVKGKQTLIEYQTEDVKYHRTRKPEPIATITSGGQLKMKEQLQLEHTTRTVESSIETPQN